MALTLNGGIDATTREIRVSGSVPGSVVAGYLFRVDDEVMEFQTFRHQWPDPVDTSRWRVRRGVGTSVAASHSNGATLFGARDAWTSGGTATPPSPFPAGGTELDADIVAALEAADSPSAGNPFATGLQSVNRELTSAELKSLLTSPITLVAGIADKVIWPLSAIAFYEAGDDAYSNASNFEIGQCDVPITAAAVGVSDAAGLISAVQGTVDAVCYIPGFNSFGPLTLAAGQPLRVFTSSGDWADGDGSVHLTVFYRIVDVPF